MEKVQAFVIGLIIVIILIAVAVYIAYILSIDSEGSEHNMFSLCAEWNNEYNCNPENYFQIEGLHKSCKTYYQASDEEAPELCYNMCIQTCNPFAKKDDENSGGELV